MKITKTKSAIFSVLFISLFIIWWCVNKQSNSTAESARSNLSQQDISWLTRMREEEKLARDIYISFWNKWGNDAFVNTSKSEQTHMDYVKVILDRYWIDDPIKDDSVWIFSFYAMKKLYDDFVFKWNKSLLDAFILSADAESLDILDASDLLQQTKNKDIMELYNNLIIWSRSHLRAYVENIKDNGGDYKPKYISQAVYDEIISSKK